MFESSDFYQATLNALDQQIALVNSQGIIVYVNTCWIETGCNRGIPNSFNWLGVNYLAASIGNHCKKKSPDVSVVDGINAVLAGKLSFFQAEYECHSDTERRWFRMTVTPIGNQGMFLISHVNISKYKLEAEESELLSMLDPLTGLANRRYMNQFMNNEWQRALRHRLPLSVILIDIDDFKVLNDALGHVAGDSCLLKVAEVIKSFSQRPTDLAVRYGGDEFALILGQTQLVYARRIAERLRKAIDALKIKFAQDQHLTISVGVSCRAHTEMATTNAQALIECADTALYKAKHDGRNRVEIFQ